MVVICPSCEARYALPDEKIGPEGRTLKCAKCKTVWFARLDSLEADSASVAPMAKADITPEPPQSFRSMVSEAGPKRLPPQKPSKISRELNPKFFATIALASCVVFALLVTLAIRGPLLALTPKAGVFYAAIGFPSEQPLKNLNFDRMKVMIEPSVRGTSALKIEGQIVNISKSSIPLPSLKVIYEGKSQKVLGQGLLRLKQTEIAGEQMIKIKETLEAVPSATQSVTITFQH